MSTLSGLVVLALLAALVYTWYRCHKRLRARGYGPVLISVAFSLLLIVSLVIGGSSRQEAVTVVLPYVLWIAVALALTWVMPARKGAVKDGRVVQVRAGERKESSIL